MIVCCKAFAFDVNRPAVEDASQKQLGNRFSEPMKPECPISTPVAPPSKNMSAKGVRLERRTSGRPIPIEIERFAGSCGREPHPLKASIAAAVGDEDRGARRDVFDLGHETAVARYPLAV